MELERQRERESMNIEIQVGDGFFGNSKISRNHKDDGIIKYR